MKLSNCFNFQDFRNLALKRLPSPIFNYIDGAADDEETYKRNTKAYNEVDLIPSVLKGVESVDLSTTIFGKRISLPVYCAPTAVQRLFHHEGELAVAKAAERCIYEARSVRQHVPYSLLPVMLPITLVEYNLRKLIRCGYDPEVFNLRGPGVGRLLSFYWKALRKRY